MGGPHHLLDGHMPVAIAASVVSIVLSIGVTCLVLVRLRPDHFVHPERRSRSLARRVLRNVGGVLLVALGVVLSFPGVPGQGLLTILLGIMLLDIAGTRRIELWILRRNGVVDAIDRLRARYGKAPLALPPVDEPAPAAGGAATDPATDPALEAAPDSRRDSTR